MVKTIKPKKRRKSYPPKKSKSRKQSKTKIPLPDIPTFQIRNLIVFLNQLVIADDLLHVVKFTDKKTGLKIANNIIKYKKKSRAFSSIEDILSVSSINEKILRLMLDGAKHQIVPERPALRGSSLPSIINPRILNALGFHIPIFFNIKWGPVANGWDQLGELHTLYDEKKTYIEKELRYAKGVVELRKEKLDKERSKYYPDPGKVKEAEEAVREAERALDELEWDIEELQDYMKDGNWKWAWDEIKENMESILLGLRVVRDHYLRLGNKYEADKRQARIDELTQEIETTQEAIDKL